MSEAISEVLEKCLQQMEAGASLDSCLAGFPKEAAELRPLLQMAQQMKHLSKVEPRPVFARNARRQLEDQLKASGKAVTLNRPNTRLEPRPLLQFNMGLLKLAIAAALALTATAGGVAYAANASNPGDFLHGLDLAVENIQLNLAPDVLSRVQLRLAFANERLAEAQATFSKNDVADGLEAMNEYGAEISAIAQLVESANGADKAELTSLLENAQGVHQDVLTKLLDTVPEQAKGSIQKALDASNSPLGLPESVPDGVGTPNGAGNPHGPPVNSPHGPPSTPAGPPSNPPGKP